jgi:hypothetical protein
MPGRAAASEGGSVRDIAVPPRPNVSSAKDERATARLEKKRDESPIAHILRIATNSAHLRRIIARKINVM